MTNVFLPPEKSYGRVHIFRSVIIIKLRPNLSSEESKIRMVRGH